MSEPEPPPLYPIVLPPLQVENAAGTISSSGNGIIIDGHPFVPKIGPHIVDAPNPSVKPFYGQVAWWSAQCAFRGFVTSAPVEILVAQLSTGEMPMSAEMLALQAKMDLEFREKNAAARAEKDRDMKKTFEGQKPKKEEVTVKTEGNYIDLTQDEEGSDGGQVVSHYRPSPEGEVDELEKGTNSREHDKSNYMYGLRVVVHERLANEDPEGWVRDCFTRRSNFTAILRLYDTTRLRRAIEEFGGLYMRTGKEPKDSLKYPKEWIVVGRNEGRVVNQESWLANRKDTSGQKSDKGRQVPFVLDSGTAEDDMFAEQSPEEFLRKTFFVKAPDGTGYNNKKTDGPAIIKVANGDALRRAVAPYSTLHIKSIAAPAHLADDGIEEVLIIGWKITQVTKVTENLLRGYRTDEILPRPATPVKPRAWDVTGKWRITYHEKGMAKEGTLHIMMGKWNAGNFIFGEFRFGFRENHTLRGVFRFERQDTGTREDADAGNREEDPYNIRLALARRGPSIVQPTWNFRWRGEYITENKHEVIKTADRLLYAITFFSPGGVNDENGGTELMGKFGGGPCGDFVFSGEKCKASRDHWVNDDLKVLWDGYGPQGAE